MPVVLLPVNGSRIHAPGEVEAWMARATTLRGFCVGCLPQDFSHGAMAGRVQTSRIWVPPLISFISS